MANHPVYGKLPYAVINRFVVNDLKTQGLLKDKVTYNGKDYVTMIPAQQIAQLNDSTSTTLRQDSYIVYSVENDDDQDEPYRKCEAVVYAVYAPTAQRVYEILYCIQDLTARKDWSVQDLQHFMDNSLLDSTSPFTFINMTFEEISGTEPTEQEDGRYAGMVSISYDYIFNDIIGTPGDVGQGRRL